MVVDDVGQDARIFDLPEKKFIEPVTLSTI
jgi:hypothetical protein